MNVYESHPEWRRRESYDKGAHPTITHLRIIQILPKPWPLSGGGDAPKIGWSSGGIARIVLGTVPVESDGSAYFRAPVNREIMFQLLDGQGVTYKSMSSGTYVHPGEKLSCIGCHEHKHRSYTSQELPLALQRPPSLIEPEVGGVKPVNYISLAKPVFDKHCVGCHTEKKKGTNFDYWLRRPRPKKNTPQPPESQLPASYLREQVVWAGASGGPWSEEKNGFCFGSLGSRLFDHLWPSHHGVRLTEEERRRVLLWMDCNALFGGGAYDPHPEVGKSVAQGQPSWPILDYDPHDPQGIDNQWAALYPTPADRIMVWLVDHAHYWPTEIDRTRLVELFDDPSVVLQIRQEDDPNTVAQFLDHSIPQYRFEATRRLVQLHASDSASKLTERIPIEPFPIILAENVLALNQLTASDAGVLALVRHHLSRCDAKMAQLLSCRWEFGGRKHCSRPIKFSDAFEARIFRAYDRVQRDSLARVVKTLKQEYTKSLKKQLRILDSIETHYRLHELTELQPEPPEPGGRQNTRLKL
jgi:hypothetical protein